MQAFKKCLLLLVYNTHSCVTAVASSRRSHSQPSSSVNFGEGICSCELGICIWDEISQMRKTCLSPVSVSVQGLACPGGGNKFLLLLYHCLLIVNCAYCLTWGGDYLLKKHQVSKAWLPEMGRKEVLVLCCPTPQL